MTPADCSPRNYRSVVLVQREVVRSKYASLWVYIKLNHCQACVAFSVSLRYAVPCGLNLCAPFQSIQTSNMSRSSIIPPAANLIEDEMRRNTFWIGQLTTLLLDPSLSSIQHT